MDVGRQVIRFIERTDTYEAEKRARAVVIAPQSDTALCAAGNSLSFAAVGGGVDDLGVCLQVHHSIGFDDCIQGK